MNMIFMRTLLIASSLLVAVQMSAQLRTDAVLEETKDTSTVVLTLDDALKIALSENVSVKVADKEIQRYEYARKGSYASLFPQVDGSGSYQRTIKKQVMYMDTDSGSEDEGGSMGMFSSLMPFIQRVNEMSVAAGLPPVSMDSGEQSSANSGGFADCQLPALGEHQDFGTERRSGCGEGSRLPSGHGYTGKTGLLRRSPRQGSIRGLQGCL